MIPPFSFDSSIHATSGRQDRVQLTIPLGCLIGTTEQIDHVRSLLCPTEEMLAGRARTWGYVFTRPNQHNSHRFPLSVRSRSLEIDGHTVPSPLFAGELKFGGYYKQNRRLPTRAVLVLSLNCNPTRLARFKMPQWQNESTVEPLGTLPPTSPDEFSLDQNDNWILQGEQDEACPARRWMGYVRRYLSGILRLLEEEIQEASQRAPVEFERQQGPFTLSKVETYWEFLSETPIPLVHQLGRLLTDFSAEETTSHFTLPTRWNRQQGHERNAPFFTVKASAGVTLKLYAKTNQRIRFEVEHDLGRNDRMLGGTHEAQNMSGAIALLKRLQVDSAGVLARAMAHMQSRNPPALSAIDKTLLTVRVGRIVGNGRTGDADGIAALIVETLASRGGICPDRQARPLVQALRRLSAEGILVFNQATGLYEPCTSYLHAVRQLQSSQRAPASPRRRRRIPQATEAIQTPPASSSAPSPPPTPRPRPIRKPRFLIDLA